MKRNYGIDLLRILSMFFVLNLHTLAHAGLLDSNIASTGQYRVAWLIEVFSYCAVDIFALISGFVGYSEKKKPLKINNYINLWLQVVFYGLLISLIIKAVNPVSIGKLDIIKMCFPLSNDLYWYFTAYTGVFILTPLLNRCVRACTVSESKRIVFVLFIVFSCYETFFGRFNLESGYSVIWLMLLYLLGAFTKKSELGKQLSTVKCFSAITILSLFTWGLYLADINITVFGNQLSSKAFASYVSPTVLGSAILYIIGASKINFHPSVEKLIKVSAPSAFAAYLINEQIYFKQYYLEGLFSSLKTSSLFFIPLCVLTFSFCFLFLSIFIDKIRNCLFNIIKINILTKNINVHLHDLLNKIH